MNTSRALLIPCWSIATLVVACGGSVDARRASPDGAGAAGSSGQANGGSDTTSTDPTAGNGAGNGNGGGTPSDCTQYLSQTPSPANAVTVHVVNQRATSIFYKTGCSPPSFDVEVDGTPQNALLPVLATRCDDAQKGNCVCGDCDSFIFIAINSGASWDITWNGTFNAPQPMPAACYPPGYEMVSMEPCFQARLASPGTATIVVHLASDLNDITFFDARQTFQIGTDSDVEIDIQ